MASQVVSALFEFTATGYEAVKKQQTEALKNIVALNEAEKELKKTQEDTNAQMEKSVRSWEAFNTATANGVALTKEERAEYAELKKSIDALTLTQAKEVVQIKEVQKARAEATKVAGQATTGMETYRKTLDALTKGAKGAEIGLDALTKTKRILTAEMAKGSNALGVKGFQDVAKAAAMVETAIRSATNEQRRLVQESGVADDSMDALAASISRATAELRKMSPKDIRFQPLTEDIKRMNDELSVMEQNAGNFRRNVGNYSSAFNPLSFQVQQLVREMPSLTVSTQQFFLAISNNLPMLVDQLGKARMVNAELLKQGEKAIPVGKQVLKSLLSWQTGLVLGITLLTKYSDEIVNFIKGMFGASDAAIDAEKALKNISDAMDSKAVAKAITDYEKLRRSYVKLTDDMRSRQKWIDENRMSLDAMGIAVNDVNDANNLFIDNTENYIEILKVRAMAEAASTLAAEKLAEHLRDNDKNIRDRKKIEEDEVTFWNKLGAAFENSAKNLKWYNALSVGTALLSSAVNDKLDPFLARIERREMAMEKEQQNWDMYIEMEAEFARQEEELWAKSGFMGVNKERAAQETNALEDQIKAYIDAYKKRLDAEKAYREAVISGDKEMMAIRKQLFDQSNEAFISAKAKEIELTEEQILELRLLNKQQYDDLREMDAEYRAGRADLYLSAVSEYRDAQDKLLAAQLAGNEQEIDVYKKLLDDRMEQLAYYLDGEKNLTGEQRLQEEVIEAERNAKIIETYQKLNQEIYDLGVSYRNAETESEREQITKITALAGEKLAIVVDIMRSMGIEVESIDVKLKKTFEDTEASIYDAVQNSLQTLQQFTGKSKNEFQKFSTSIAALVAKAFDIKKVRAKYGTDAEGIKEANKELLNSFSELGAAVAINGLNAITESILSETEAEMEAVDRMFEYQEERAKESYDRQSALLKLRYDRDEMTEAAYRLEQIKLDNKKAAEDEKREKQKAERLYQIELKQFNVQKAQDAISAGIATALAVMQTFATLGFPAGVIPAAAMTAIGAAQVGAIVSKKAPPMPKYSHGGEVRFEKIEGESHANGGVPVKFGNKTVAEVEGDEGALIISRKAMKNKYMRNLLGAVLKMNRDISGSSSGDGMFAAGGEMDFLDYEKDFYEPAREKYSVLEKGVPNIGKLRERIIAQIDELARQEANLRWNDYYERTIEDLEKREEKIVSDMNRRISENGVFAEMGVSDIFGYNKTITSKEEQLKLINDQTKALEEQSKIQIDALKTRLQYEEKLSEYEERRKKLNDELTAAQNELGGRVLKEMLEAGTITVDEYSSMLDQIKVGYGKNVSDIIKLRKEEVEAVKKQINEQRDAEITAAKEVADFRRQALDKIREDFKTDYDSVTEAILNGTTLSQEAVSRLSKEELAAYNSAMTRSKEILLAYAERAKLEAEFRRNEEQLTDGVITNRKERANMVARQLEIQRQLENSEKQRSAKEAQLQEAREQLAKEREDNFANALSVFEAENFEKLLEQIKEMGAQMQEDANKWSLDKQLAADLDEILSGINSTYDEQIAKQDEIIAGLEAELDAAKLLHDQKLAYLKIEEDAFKSSFELQRSQIERALADATAGLRTEAADLAAFIANLRVAGLGAGVQEYEKALEALNSDISNLEGTGGRKYATGGAIEIGSGLYQVTGASHADGGVGIHIGNTKIAEVEGAEKMFAVNKLAANDPEMISALARASDINARYTGVHLLDGDTRGRAFSLDYDLLAEKIGSQINSRPMHTYITHEDIREAYDIRKLHKKASLMQ